MFVSADVNSSTEQMPEQSGGAVALAMDEPIEPDASPEVNDSARRAIDDLSNRIQRLIEPIDAPVFLKQIFCQTLDWQYVNLPVPSSLLPESAREGLADAHIIAQCQDIRLCYLRTRRSDLLAGDERKALDRLANAWPAVVVAFANFGQNQLDIAVKTSDGRLHRISIDRSLFGPGELSQALYALRAFEVTSEDAPAQLEVAERLERQFKRLPRRMRKRIKLDSDPFFREIGRHRLLTHAEEMQLRPQFSAGERHACRDKLILANLRLVVSIACRYRNRGVALEDLLQIGVIGLMRAADKYEPERGFRFSTYATWWIRQRVSRAVDEEANLISLPAHFGRILASYRRLIHDHKLYFGCRPTDNEIQDFFELDRERWITLRQAVSASMRPSTLDTVADTDGLRVRHCHPRARNHQLDSAVEIRDRAAAVEQVIQQRLDHRSAEVIRRRFGIGGRSPETLEQIGNDYGLTRERIRQIEASAMHRIARRLRTLFGDPSWPLPHKKEDQEKTPDQETPSVLEHNLPRSTDAAE